MGVVLIVGACVSTGLVGAVTVTVPGAPAVTSATVGLHEVTVAFMKPASDGGERISTYRAQCTSRNGGVGGSRNGPSSPLRVAGLTNNRSYTCTVAAHNDVGLGRASAPSRAVIVRPALPSAPKITSVRAGFHSVTVAFAKPADDGGAKIAIYRVRCTSRADGLAKAHEGAQSPIGVTGLAANLAYVCTVAASNNVGFGLASAPSSRVVADPTAPGAPKITSVRAGVRMVTIAFIAPKRDGGAPIESYRAICTSKNGGVARAQNTPTSPNRVVLMTGGATYTCTVTATNNAGTGPPSAPSGPVKPRAH